MGASIVEGHWCNLGSEHGLLILQAPEQSVKQPAGAERRADDVSSVKQLLPKPCHQHVDTSFLSFALFTETLCWEF